MLATRLDPDYGVVGGTQLRLGDEALQAAVRRWGVWKSEAAGKLGLESSVAARWASRANLLINLLFTVRL